MNKSGRKEIAPGFFVNLGHCDELSFFNNWTPSDFEKLIEKLFSQHPKEKLKTIQGAIKSWHNPRLAFSVINLLKDIQYFQSPKRRASVPSMKAALVRFGKAVEKNGFGQINIFPNFVKSLRSLKVAFNQDLAHYVFSHAPYSLRVKQPDQKKRRGQNKGQLNLEPFLGRGNPTSVQRDHVINYLVRTIEGGLEINRTRAVRMAMPLLRAVGCSLHEKHVRAIADRNFPNLTTIDPPQPRLVMTLLKGPFSKEMSKK